MKYKIEWDTGSRWELVAVVSVPERPTRAFATAFRKQGGPNTVHPELAKRLRATPYKEERAA